MTREAHKAGKVMNTKCRISCFLAVYEMLPGEDGMMSQLFRFRVQLLGSDIVPYHHPGYSCEELIEKLLSKRDTGNISLLTLRIKPDDLQILHHAGKPFAFDTAPTQYTIKYEDLRYII